MGTSAGGFGTLLSAVARMSGGRAVQTSDNAAAGQSIQAGQQAVAASQRGAIDQTRRYDLLASTAQARAAAAGGGASDPTVTKIISDIAAEGQYRSLLEMNKGAVQQAGYQQKANTLKAEGENARTAGNYGAIATILTPSSVNNMQSLWQKYGGKGPPTAGASPDGSDFSDYISWDRAGLSS